MQDIKKPYSRSKSNKGNDIASRVEQFERRSYSLEEDTDEESAPMTTRRKSDIDLVTEVEEKEVHLGRRSDDLIYRDTRTKYRNHENKTGTYIFMGVIAAIILFIGLSTYVFDSATVTFVPKTKDVQVSQSFTFSTDKTSTSSIYYELATSSVSKSKSLPLSETKKVEAKASGQIIVYNNFDSNPQKLIKNTRFESSNGKIFRINESITVPGKKGDVPGSVEVTVFADSYGVDYNLAPSDFTIPGFKGSPRYKGFFARSNGAMSGGASGNTSLVSVVDLNAAKDELAMELTKEAKDALKVIKKDGYMGLYDSVQVVITDNEQDLRIGKSSNYQATATGYLMLADKSALAKNIATLARDYANENVKLAYDDTLHFSLKDTVNLTRDNKVDVLIEGEPKVVWVSDENVIAGLLTNKKKEEFVTVMKGIPSIEKAEINFSPMWLSTFPSKTSAISFVENIPKR